METPLRYSENNERKEEPSEIINTSKKKRGEFGKYKELFVGTVCGALLCYSVSGCSFRIDPLQPVVDAGSDSSVDSGRDAVVDAVVDSTVDALVDATPDGTPEASVDDGGVVCNGTYDATNVNIIIWRNNAREVGGMCFRYMTFNTDVPPLVTMDVECNGDANCNNTVKAKIGIVLEEGTPYPDVISNTAVDITYNELISGGDRLDVTISVVP